MSRLKGVFLSTYNKMIIPLDYNDTLEDLQRIIGGHIEYVQVDDRLFLICDEEGKLKNLPINNNATKLIDCRDVIVGNCLLVATDGENNANCTYRDLQNVLKKCGA